MFTETFIRKSDLKNKATYRISIKGDQKFNIDRKVETEKKKLSVDEFLKIANDKFFGIYGKNFDPSLLRRRDLTKYDSIIWGRWASINQRTVNGKYNSSPSALACPQLKSYRAKGITLNMTFGEFEVWMKSVEHIHNQIVEKGENSSVDRIDETKGYEIDNLQMISLHENIEKRIGKKCKRYPEENKQLKKESNHKIYQNAKKTNC